MFSTWEKELHKIVFDRRYLLLASKERKQIYEQYVKERADDERKEKVRKLRQRKDEFRQLLIDAKLRARYEHYTHMHVCYCNLGFCLHDYRELGPDTLNFP